MGAAERTETVANVRVRGTHGAPIQTRYTEEYALLGTLVGRPRYYTASHHVRRVGRDGRLSHCGDLYQLPLVHALTIVEVGEDLTGRVTLRAADGQLLNPMIVRAGEAPTPRVPSPAGWETPRSLLQLVYPAAPTVELRDLA